MGYRLRIDRMFISQIIPWMQLPISSSDRIYITKKAYAHEFIPHQQTTINSMETHTNVPLCTY
jgi:hypothetical protein